MNIVERIDFNQLKIVSKNEVIFQIKKCGLFMLPQIRY